MANVSENSASASETLQVIFGVVGIFAAIVVVMVVYALPSFAPMWVQVAIGIAGWALLIWRIIESSNRKKSASATESEKRD